MHVDGERPKAAPRRDRFLVVSAAVALLTLPVAYWLLEVDITTLWAPRARDLAGMLGSDAWPPRIGAGGMGELIADSIDTIALAVLAIALAWLVASPLSFVASRPADRAPTVHSWLRRALAWVTRLVLLIARAVPPPVWAFIVLLVVFPGLWPGAVALAIYNGGVLGRLQAELVENLDPEPANVLRASGATGFGTLTHAVVPAVSSKFVAVGLYRWEVAIRETVVVGVVGADGLGRRLDEQTSAFDFDGILATIIALLVVTVAVDVASAFVRSSLR
jgi:phosphonate transport system permease protein